ncbi:MAG: DUF1572 family protein [Planctomycetota bacterium]
MNEGRTGTAVIASAVAQFRSLRRLAEGAMTQLDDRELREVPAGGAGNNSVAVVVKHMAGNMRSRWTDFLTTDGEKPDRNRDQEFVDDFESRAAVEQAWEQGWTCVFAALEPLTDDQLGQIVTIRGEAHSVLEAVHRQLTHYSYHTGQIVSTARWFLGERWQSLSISRGGSEAYNAEMRDQHPRG